MTPGLEELRAEVRQFARDFHDARQPLGFSKPMQMAIGGVGIAGTVITVPAAVADVLASRLEAWLNDTNPDKPQTAPARPAFDERGYRAMTTGFGWRINADLPDGSAFIGLDADHPTDQGLQHLTRRDRAGLRAMLQLALDNLDATEPATTIGARP